MSQKWKILGSDYHNLAPGLLSHSNRGQEAYKWSQSHWHSSEILWSTSSIRNVEEAYKLGEGESYTSATENRRTMCFSVWVLAVSTNSSSSAMAGAGRTELQGKTVPCKQHPDDCTDGNDTFRYWVDDRAKLLSVFQKWSVKYCSWLKFPYYDC